MAMAGMEMIVNGTPTGEIGDQLFNVGFDPGLLRPFIDDDGVRKVVLNTGRTKLITNSNGKSKRVAVKEVVRLSDLNQADIPIPINNATTLRKDEWIRIDRAVRETARLRLKAFQDLANANTYGGFDGMAKMVLEYENISDPGAAIVDMDGLTEGPNDQPLFQLEGLPLPITHSDFTISDRRLRISRNSGTPLDTTLPAFASRRVNESIERVTIGTNAGVTYGTSTDYSRTSKVYGYTNFPDRVTKTNLTQPTGSNPETTVAEVLSMRESLMNVKQYGPYMLYHSTDWDQYMDNDYARLGGNNASMTLRDRLRKIEGITDVKRLDYLDSTNHPWTLLMVQMTEDNARAVIGMNLVTVQWPTKGGLQMNFKVMCIKVPQLRADYDGNCGILQATTS